tara:strand:- start:5678 stop:6022 length:345 start_codon:yes stop_codon:yes gene_type:complete
MSNNVFNSNNKELDYLYDLNEHIIEIDDMYRYSDNFQKHPIIDNKRTISKKIDNTSKELNRHYLLTTLLILIIIITILYCIVYILGNNISTSNFIIYFVGLIFLAFFLQYILKI